MAAYNALPNERSKVRHLAGTEATRGAGATQTFQLLGDFRVNERQPLIEREEYTGTLDPWVTPELGLYDVDGTYNELLTFESLATHLRYGMNGTTASTTPADDAQTVHGYTYTYDPCTQISDLDSMEIEHGPPGLPELATGVMHKQFTISADSDDADGCWKWDSQCFLMNNAVKASAAPGVLTATGGTVSTVVKAAAGWTVDALIGAYVFIRSGTAIGDVRLITDNDATSLTVAPDFSATIDSGDTFEISAQFTAGIAVPSYEKIKAAGTKVYIDDTAAGIGVTQLADKSISWSLTHALDMNPKRFMEYETGYSAKLGTGWRRVTGQMRIEFDDLHEYNHYKASSTRSIRISREGSIIDSGAVTKKIAKIDIYDAYWSEVTRDQDRNANLTRIFAFKGYYGTTARVARIAVKNKLSALP